MSSKALHKHAVPVVMFGAILIVVSAVGVSDLLHTQTTTDSKLSLLSKRLMSIKPSSNGLFSMSRYQPKATEATVKSAVAPSTGLGQVSNAGDTAKLSATLSSFDTTTAK